MAPPVLSEPNAGLCNLPAGRVLRVLTVLTLCAGGQGRVPCIPAWYSIIPVVGPNSTVRSLQAIAEIEALKSEAASLLDKHLGKTAEQVGCLLTHTTHVSPHGTGQGVSATLSCGTG